jgi:hypothetical protein
MMARLLLLFVMLAGVLLGQAERDRAIEADIQTRLAKSVIGAEGFQVRVEGGVAYWTGKTAVAQRKGAATRMAKSAGAVKVVNNIRVTTGKAPPKASQKRSEPKSAPAAPRTEEPPPRRPRVQWRDLHR